MFTLQARIILAAALLCATLAIAWAGYRAIYNRGYDRAMQEVATATAKANETYRAREREFSRQLEDARNAAIEREKTLRRDADLARKSADSLRNQLADAKRAMSTASAEAVRQYAATLSDVLEDCTGRYTALAKEADGHASDSQTLAEGWPK